MEPENENKLPELSLKEVNFCEEYCVDGNATRAAIAAGYSERSARQIASRLLTKDNIKAYVAKCQKETERLAGVSRLRNARELANIAYSSIAHLHNSWTETKDFEDLTDQQKACIEIVERKVSTIQREGDTDIQIEYVKIKLHSKIEAIKELNKMFGYNSPDKFQVEGSVTVTSREMSPAEAREYLKKLNSEI